MADEAARLLESLRRTAAESAVGEPVGHDGADAAGPAPAAGSTSASASAGAGAGTGGAGAGEGDAERGMPGATPAGAGTGGAGAGEGAAERGMPDATSSAGGPDGSAHDPFCTWCPLCRGAAVVRSLSPETLGKLADLATLAATVLTDLAISRPAGGPPASHPDHRAPGTGGGTAPGRRPRRPGPAQSRPIPVTDADDSQEAPRG